MTATECIERYGISLANSGQLCITRNQAEAAQHMAVIQAAKPEILARLRVQQQINRRKPALRPSAPYPERPGSCPRCHSYCDGDCRSY